MNAIARRIEPPVNARGDVVRHHPEPPGSRCARPAGNGFRMSNILKRTNPTPPMRSDGAMARKRHLHPDELVDDDARGVRAPVLLGLMSEIDRDGKPCRGRRRDARATRPPARRDRPRATRGSRTSPARTGNTPCRRTRLNVVMMNRFTPPRIRRLRPAGQVKWIAGRAPISGWRRWGSPRRSAATPCERAP